VRETTYKETQAGSSTDPSGSCKIGEAMADIRWIPSDFPYQANALWDFERGVRKPPGSGGLV
jgi:hypothetical protein